MSRNIDVNESGPLCIWGLPLMPWTFAQALDEVEKLVHRGKPSFFITANLHYAMLSAQDARLRSVNRDAAFILADGMPLVWASRWKKNRLPERVTGADLVPALCQRAADKGYRLFLLGGAPGVASEAAAKLCQRFPGLQIVGTESPPFHELSPGEHAQMVDRVREARPHLLFAALGQPKGEVWLHANFQALGVPVCAQIGASLDFAAGRVPRAPRVLQKVGLEWVYRLYREPRRLFLRYLRNGLFISHRMACDAVAMLDGNSPSVRSRGNRF
jgi:N-acetylglucosaminyldiphosphoundecaprenol N-acetyl-beta-D-mannosaminyltransferase